MEISLNPCSTGITFLTRIYFVGFIGTPFRLNPCSTGITFLTIKSSLVSLVDEGLNPCSTGITFLTAKTPTCYLSTTLFHFFT